MMAQKSDEVRKQLTGRSIIEFINDYRIFKSVQMLRSGETNITKVAQKCGFRDVRTFRAAFKLRMEVTPSSFINT